MRVRRLMLAALAALSVLGVGLVSTSAALAAGAPTVEAQSSSGVTPFDAVLEAQVNPNEESTAITFEYATNEALTGATTVTGPTIEGGSQPVAADIGGGLTPNQIYYYRVVATNATGTTDGTPVQSFNTLVAEAPAVGTQSSSSVTPFDGVLEAQVNPNYQETTTTFEYATNEALTENLKTVAGATFGGFGEQPTSADIGGGLTPNTTYYYRVVATNGTGKTEGAPVQTFTTLEAFAPEISGENLTELTSTRVDVNGQINPDYQETVYAADCGTGEDPSNDFQTYPGTEPISAANGSQPVPVSIAVTGLTPNTKYSCWLVATNLTGESKGVEMPFQTQDQPGVVTGASSNITRTTAALAGTVDPAGVSTYYHFVYGTTEGYGRSTSEVAAGESFENIAAGAALEELAPGTTYHYALVATNIYGTVMGADRTFATLPPTPPTASTGGTLNVGHQSAILTGTVDPDGLPTVYKFELGTETGVYYPQTFGSASGSGGQGVSLELQSLAAGVTYHYRIVAENADGISRGQDQTFTTESYPNPLSVPVSPALIPIAPATPPAKVVAKKAAKKPVKHKKHKKSKKKKKKKK